MKRIIEILANFISLMRNEVLEYYQKTSSYLKDLIIYKKIDLKRKIEAESDKEIKNSLIKMLKAIKTGLNTLGISMDKLNGYQSDFLEVIKKERSNLLDYNSFFDIYMEKYGNEILFVVLLDYLFDIDTKKLENVNLFDLLPDNFISKLNEFKNISINSEEIKQSFQQFNYKEHVNFTDLTTITPKPKSEPDILTQLRVAKEDIIETLKIPKKELVKPSVESLREESSQKEPTTLNTVTINKTPVSTLNQQAVTFSDAVPSEQKDLGIITDSETFLDAIGQSSPINSELINIFKIDKVNLINLKMINKEFFNLENLFYYISIVKMLNLEFPFTDIEIFVIIKEYLNGKMFSSSKDNPPDLQNIFYGLAILSELDMLDKSDHIDLHEIEKFIRINLEPFIPEKVELNLYSILCLKLLTRKGNIKFDKNSILRLIQDLNVLQLENSKLPLDIYRHLALIKLLNKDLNLQQFKHNYLNELKKLMEPNGSIRNLITDSAQGLLIINLLDLKEHESEFCNNILNYIFNTTKFFNVDNLNRDFNWRIDKLGFSIELEMLYWALFASSQ